MHVVFLARCDACFVLGASANGWMKWKDKCGRTLDELFRRQAEKA
ncbi:DUF4357 domain-containing protein [Butyricicoccus sp. AM32-19]|nr:DUF4357 domain-containing protein [Butyricicoccus sp. AM32-19]RHV80373.1 DUF4357 domain-containing protein [Butyricicoccus sp. OF10-2]